MEELNFNQHQYNKDKKPTGKSLKNKPVKPNNFHLIIDQNGRYQINFGAWAKGLCKYDRCEIEIIPNKGLFFAFQKMKLGAVAALALRVGGIELSVCYRPFFLCVLIWIENK
jgi:hypothetical protein